MFLRRGDQRFGPLTRSSSYMSSVCSNARRRSLQASMELCVAQQTERSDSEPISVKTLVSYHVPYWKTLIAMLEVLVYNRAMYLCKSEYCRVSFARMTIESCLYDGTALFSVHLARLSLGNCAGLLFCSRHVVVFADSSSHSRHDFAVTGEA